MEYHHSLPDRGLARGATLPFDAYYSGLPSPMLSKHLPFFSTEEVNGDPSHLSNDFSIRLARSTRCLLESGMLIERMYAWRGYESVSPEIMMPSAKQMTVQACRGKQVFGTITLRADSATGLQADQLYAEEIDAIRQEGRIPCELTGLAVDPRQGSIGMLACLFHAAYIVGRSLHEATDFLIEVNPRHAKYYHRLIGYVQAGPQRICERVGAPAILMRITFEYLEEQIAHYANHKMATKRSIYPHILSKAEERDLRRRVLSKDHHIQPDIVSSSIHNLCLEI